MTQGLVTNGHGDRASGVDDLGATGQPVGGSQGNRPNLAPTEMLGDFGQDRALLVTEGEIDRDGVEDLGHPIGRELDIDHRSGDLDDPAHTLCFSHFDSSFRPNSK